MEWQQWVMVLLFAGTIAGLIKFQKAPQRVFGAACLICLALSFVSVGDLLANAVNPGLVTLLLLIISAFALERTSAMHKLTAKLINGSVTKSYIRTFFATIFSSALVNNTAVIAALLGPVRSNKLINPSRILLPLSYAAIMGGTLTLVGTSTNLIVNSLLIDQTGVGFNFFDFSLIGLSVLLPCMAVIMLTLSTLPNTKMEQQKVHSYFLEAEIEANSQLIGKSIEANGLRNLDSLFLVEVIRGHKVVSAVTPDFVLQGGDKLIFSGDVSSVLRLKQFDGLSLFAEEDGLLGENLTEAIVKEESAITGQTLKEAGFRARFDAAVVAIRREGQSLSGKLGNIRIQAGDFLVMAAGRDFASRPNISKNFFILSGISPKNFISGWRERLVIWGFIAALAISIVTDVSLIKTLLFYLAAVVVSNSFSINEIQRRLPLDLLLIVISALTIAKALDNTGVSALVASSVHVLLLDVHVYWAFIAIYLFTVLLTELITNNAAAALSFPIAYSVAIGLGVSPVPFIMIVAFGASASFVSPYGYQTNLMVFNAGNYKLAEFVKFGLPVSLVYGAMVLWVTPLVYPF
ncbi:SLC13 family permease [Dasania sp. GY-MA-18]|uniref:SLC13 family permease n=1 Tax=Dasania phycosphaerae TaxID=2950436 RepID=A0A9J6RQ71_9GAMM|nr:MULTISPECIES: SLC13 family permease [Dasania]MCR8923747.1 SLC13 family permease [Dasania sp. GY-MA-18]MCZ0866181.1 SLC13 family permease [Dasania phycosphaerae]MCZ0869905.1 SLC13 family permease [Dasania phycosphaerae]